MAIKDDVQIWLGIAGVGIGLVGIYLYSRSAQAQAAPLATNTTTATLPTLAAPTISTPTYTLAPLDPTQGAVASGASAALAPASGVQPSDLLAIFSPPALDWANTQTLLDYSPYGNSAPAVASPIVASGLPSPDGGASSGSCGCSSTQPTTYYGSPQAQAAGIATGTTTFGSSGANSPGVPGYNNGQAITPSGTSGIKMSQSAIPPPSALATALLAKLGLGPKPVYANGIPPL